MLAGFYLPGRPSTGSPGVWSNVVANEPTAEPAEPDVIDSSGLRSLVAVSKDASARGLPLTLRNVPRHAQRVLELTGLDAWFDVKTGS